MNHNRYSEQLRDPRWQRKKNRILDRDNYTCQFCGSDQKTLHVHHTFYLKNAAPWDYKDEGLITLCDQCHADHEECKVDVIRLVGRFPADDLLQLNLLLHALIETNCAMCHCSNFTEGLAGTYPKVAQSLREKFGEDCIDGAYENHETIH